jgi:hypothetical protein
MIKSIFLILVTGTFLIVNTAIYSSAVKACKVKAKVMEIIPNNTDEPGTFLKIKVLNTSFYEGHSAGKDCTYLDDIETKVFLPSKKIETKEGIKFEKWQFKKNDIITLVHEKVYNINSGKKKIYTSWSVLEVKK